MVFIGNNNRTLNYYYLINIHTILYILVINLLKQSIDLQFKKKLRMKKRVLLFSC